MKTAQDVRKREYRCSHYHGSCAHSIELIGIMDRYKHDLGE